ncbi:polysaccharide deacetylase family protein [Candidatus Woesearchaeota archaeon]|nr:polysaccharide deacetylase family protein [Candidatus Woesearchaeota archaeon]
MKYLLLTFDLEEFIANEFGLQVPMEVCMEISKKGFQQILRILERNGCKATLFTTAEFAAYCPELMKKAIARGHEIGLHGYSHKDRYGKMKEEEAYARLHKAKEKLEGIAGMKVVSFRAPQMSRPPYPVLGRLGLLYDSSYHPTYIPGHYNLFFKTRKIHTTEGITVIPVSVSPLLRLPFSWIWLRNMPLAYAKACSRLSLISGGYLNLYFHPWEFINVSGFAVHPSLVVRKTGQPFVKKFEEFVQWCITQGMMPMTVRELMREEGK